VLDYGGGNDVLCAALRAAGFAQAVTYDPLVPEFMRRPEGHFDLITCFETIEHMPNPLAGIESIVRSAAQPGLVIFSTLLQPADFEERQLAWWYVAPRNGHVSIFSRQALMLAWRKYGYQVASFDSNLHLAFRTVPRFARHLVR
jgi:SAM-dependent methyltransferase